MKKNTKRLIQIIGGIIMMAGISGCGASGNNPETPTESRVKASRTPEEAAVEAQFEPLFEFLAAEKKDFSRVERYSSSFTISVLNEAGNEYIEEESYDLVFENISDGKGGKYSITRNGEKREYAIDLNEDKRTIAFQSDMQLNQFVFPILEFRELADYEISDYLLIHPETELKTVAYHSDSQFPIISQIVEENKISSIDKTELSFSKRGDNEYGALIGVISSERMLLISLSISFME